MTGLAGFDFQALNRKYIAAPSNDATAYGVSIVRARSMTAYRCIGVYHLTPEQNNRRHNVYVEVLDEHGQRDRTPMLNWAVSLDGAMKSKPLDKPDNEPAADIPMFMDDYLVVRISDGKPGGDSDSVVGLRVRHPDEGSGNTFGHHSFFVCFQRQNAMMPPVDPPIDPEPPTAPELTLESLAVRLAAVEVDNQLLRKELIDQGVQIDLIKRRLDAMEGD